MAPVSSSGLPLCCVSHSPLNSCSNRPRDYSTFLKARGEAPISVRRCESLEELLQQADVVSLHCVLDAR